MRSIQELILESEQLRIETHSAGPQDEVEFWKRRAAKLTLLVEQISSEPCRMTVATLKVAQSKLVKVGRFFLLAHHNRSHSCRYGRRVSIRSSNIMLKRWFVRVNLLLFLLVK